MDDGTVLEVSSAGEMVPDLPRRPLALRPIFGVDDSSSVAAQEDGGEQTVTNAQRRKRMGDDLDAPPSLRTRTSSQLHQLAGDDDLRA